MLYSHVPVLFYLHLRFTNHDFICTNIIIHQQFLDNKCPSKKLIPTFVAYSQTMMKLRFTALILLPAIFIIASCSNDENADYPEIQETTSQISLAIEPSIEQSEIPMVRASSSTSRGLYAINVYWQGKGLTSYQPYVSGLFNDVSQIDISLIDGYKYRFDCSFLEESELPYSISENGITKYGRPFALAKDGNIYAPVTNKLTVSLTPFDTNTQFYQGAYSGNTETEEGVVLPYPSNHRYYGSNTVDLTRTTESHVIVNIELRRAYCNLLFESKDIPQGDKIEVTLSGTNRAFYITGTGGKNIIQSEEHLLALNKTADRWGGAINASESVGITVQYYSSTTHEWRLIYQNSPSITLKRNKRNIIKFVNIDQATGEGNIHMGEGEITGSPTDSEYQEIS